MWYEYSVPEPESEAEPDKVSPKMDPALIMSRIFFPTRAVHCLLVREGICICCIGVDMVSVVSLEFPVCEAVADREVSSPSPPSSSSSSSFLQNT